jgi:hypothetical protein
VGLPPPQPVVISNVIGLPEGDANQTLRNAGLVVGEPIKVFDLSIRAMCAPSAQPPAPWYPGARP